jgi:hypothetical protein
MKEVLFECWIIYKNKRMFDSLPLDETTRLLSIAVNIFVRCFMVMNYEREFPRVSCIKEENAFGSPIILG